MSHVCVLDGKYKPRVNWKISNEAFSWVWCFSSDRLPEVHIFHLEHILGDMNYFLNWYNVKTKNKQFDAIKTWRHKRFLSGTPLVPIQFF